jgi:hypothetical protein
VLRPKPDSRVGQESEPVAEQRLGRAGDSLRQVGEGSEAYPVEQPRLRSRQQGALQLDPEPTDAPSNDSPSNFCDATTMYGTGTPQDFGTPKAVNTQCTMLPPAGMCDMGGGNLRAVVKPAANALQITEFLANPGTGATGSDSTREWFEIKNTSGAAFDLNGLTFASASSMSTVNVPACISIAGGAYGLIARSGDAAQNGMLPAPDATFGFSLVDTNGKIEVRDGATVLETVVWTSVFTPTTANPMGVARALDPPRGDRHAAEPPHVCLHSGP